MTKQEIIRVIECYPQEFHIKGDLITIHEKAVELADEILNWPTHTAMHKVKKLFAIMPKPKF